MRRRTLLQSILAGTGTAFSAVAFGNLAQIEQVRRELDKILDGSELGDATVERWEALPSEYGHRNQVVASAQLLNEIAGDFVELQALLERQHSVKHRITLTHVAGQLAQLAGLFMLDLGELRNAQAWFHTAGLAASEARDGQLAGVVLVLSATANLYNGAPDKALDRLAKAQATLGQQPTPSRTRALLAQARVLAELGRTRRQGAASPTPKPRFRTCRPRPLPILALAAGTACSCSTSATPTPASAWSRKPTPPSVKHSTCTGQWSTSTPH